MVEQVTVNHRVGGSSPSSGAVIRLAVASIYRNGHFREGVPVLLSAELVLDRMGFRVVRRPGGKESTKYREV